MNHDNKAADDLNRLMHEALDARVASDRLPERLRQALSRDANLRAEWEALRRADDAFDELLGGTSGGPQLPSGMRGRVMEKVRLQPEPLKRAGRKDQILWTAMIGVAAAALAILAMSQQALAPPKPATTNERQPVAARTTEETQAAEIKLKVVDVVAWSEPLRASADRLVGAGVELSNSTQTIVSSAVGVFTRLPMPPS